jgi:long-chain acyl-CoA synthetase
MIHTGDRMGLYDCTLYDIIRRNAACHADHPCWLDSDDQRPLTFAEFKHQVDRLATGLQRRSHRPGERIGVLGKNSLEFFRVYGAAAALGAIVVPINWRLSAEEVYVNLADTAPATLFVDQEYQALISELLPRLPSVRECFNLRGDQGAYGTLLALLAGEEPFAPPAVAGSDGLVIIHTAAVAGRPRGALLSHANLLCANLLFNLCFGLTRNDVHLNLLPLFHVAGLGMALQAFHAGAMNLNMSKFDAERAVELIERHRASVLFEFSPILGSLLDAAERSGRCLPSLRAVMGLDNAETIERYQRLTGGTFYAMYGQTETSCLASLGAYNDAPGSAGRPISLGAVALLDENGTPVDSDAVGEIALRGPLVFQGYWNLPEDTAHTFRDGWHHTGDLGRMDAGGFLWYAGRKTEKELIKPGGENVYPAEVEAAILKHPAVAAVVVFGVPDPKWKEGIKAVCQLKPGARLDARELIGFVGKQIASFKKPQYVAFVDSLPTLSGGALDRQQIKTLHGKGDNA